MMSKDNRVGKFVLEKLIKQKRAAIPSQQNSYKRARYSKYARIS